MRNRFDGKGLTAGRSVVMGSGGMVASSHPLASLTGIRILLEGGNFVDAAVATAAVLNVVEPMMTGIGGDMFAMIYEAKKDKLRGLNGSGRSPANLTRDAVLKSGFTTMPATGMLTVTVPGALDGWAALLDEYGTMELSRLLQPAITYAEEGFIVTEAVSRWWSQHEGKLREYPSSRETYLPLGRAPRAGERFRQKNLANSLRMIAEGGEEVFYGGELGERIVRFCQENGGFLTVEDLRSHTSTWVEPIWADYRGYRLYELPPNGQGIVALMALNILEGFDLPSMKQNDPEYLHLLIEAVRLAFDDGGRHVGDPDFSSPPIDALLSQGHAEERRGMIDRRSVNRGLKPPLLPPAGDTTYFTVVDCERNAISFINSIYRHFGSGIVAGDTGVCLHNRGSLFNLQEGHPNCLEPLKRPYHTIIPAMLFKDGRLSVSFGVMGAFMQPQGHLQVVCNLVDFGMNVQEALEAPRFRYVGGKGVALEEGISPDTRKGLAEKGHSLIPSEGVFFGGGQAIMIDRENGALMGGSDPRMDGCALGY